MLLLFIGVSFRNGQSPSSEADHLSIIGPQYSRVERLNWPFFMSATVLSNTGLWSLNLGNRFFALMEMAQFSGLNDLLAPSRKNARSVFEWFMYALADAKWNVFLFHLTLPVILLVPRTDKSPSELELSQNTRLIDARVRGKERLPSLQRLAPALFLRPRTEGEFRL